MLQEVVKTNEVSLDEFLVFVQNSDLGILATAKHQAKTNHCSED